MNKEVQEYAKTHKVLTLQITRQNFNDIKDGKQKVEHRYIYPSNAKRYVYDIELKDEKGDVIDTDVEPIQYDALYLINGRKQEAPRMLIEVKNCEFVVIVDENDNVRTYVEDGVEYVVCQVWYHLGEVLNLENC